MQPDKRENIDKFVSDAMRRIKPAYSESMWQNIEGQLPPVAKTPRMPVFYKAAAVALLFFSLAGGLWFVNNQNNSGKNISVKNDKKAANKNIAVNENPYKASEKNASANSKIPADKIELTENKSSQNIANKYSGFNKKSISNKNNRVNKNPIVKPIELVNPNPETIDNSIYVPVEKYFIALTDQKNMLVENERDDIGIDEENSKKNYRKGNNKNKHNGFSTNWQNITYNFWKNAAYTGEQARYNFSFDDKFSYFDEVNVSDYHNTFAFDMRIPKTRFSAGLYHQRNLKGYSLRTTTGLSVSAALFSIGNGYLRAGVSAFRYESNLFKNSLLFNDQIDPYFFGITQTTRQRDFTSTSTAIGYDAGLWYGSPGLIAGISVKNINRPLFGYLESGQRLEREWTYAAGYNVNVIKGFTVMPWMELRQTPVKKITDAMVLIGYKNKVMIGGGIKNLNAETRSGGDAAVYASVEIKNRLRLFGSYAQNLEMKKIGFTQNIVHTGLRYQIQ